jgi:hypothetical protein
VSKIAVHAATPDERALHQRRIMAADAPVRTIMLMTAVAIKAKSTLVMATPSS